ncbi:MAG: GNAT family N-acetyltransferase [Pseudomonadales bacterium]
METSTNFTFKYLPSIDLINAEIWNSLCASDYPFLRHEFLASLEHSGSVGGNSGWQPYHLTAYQNGILVAVMPLYIKTHSYGEYVFDWAWAEAYQRHNVTYYPKLLSAIPFTPASGPRLCAEEGINKTALMSAIVEDIQAQTESGHFSSWHLLFPESGEFDDWQKTELSQRTGCQFHWFNRDYKSFDDFLSTFTSRKRKSIKRERRRVVEQDITLQSLSGDHISEKHIRDFFIFYQATYMKRGQQGYLTLDFFLQLRATMADQLVLVMAEKDGQAVAAALCLRDSETLYGRYWGCLEEYECLHFEACFYQGIEYCIANGLQRFDPGAQGEHKILRGFEPVKTVSLHWIAHEGFREAVDRFLGQEKLGMAQYKDDATAMLPFKK